MTSDPSDHGDHYLNLPGAKLMATVATRTTQELLSTVIEARAIGCIHGDVGLGKTLAVNVNLRDLAPRTTIQLQIRPGPPLSTFCDMLFQALELPGEVPTSVAACDRLFRDALATQPKVLICDEAQGLTPKVLDYLRSLWDRTPHAFALVFVGGENCRQRILSRPALASRIIQWQQYSPLTPDEILQIIPDYHPVWAEAAPGDLLWVDDMICHGNFRNWARTTFHMQAASGKPAFDDLSFKDRVRAILGKIDPGWRPPPGR